MRAAAAAALASSAALASAAANPIVRENALPGSPSTEWDVNGKGDVGVEGFATRASLLPGATVRFKVKIAKPESLRIDIYRIGWYGGDGARKLGHASVFDAEAAISQPPCRDMQKRSRSKTKTEAPHAPLWDCGNWRVVAEYTLPENATSGLYVARAVLPVADPRHWRRDASPVLFDRNHAVEGADPRLPPASTGHAYGGAGKNALRNALREPRATHMWFVVREGKRSAARGLRSGRKPLLFQTSDTTWHAYNGYGGLTTYGSFDYPFEHLPHRTPMNITEPGHDLRRAFKRSYNTPLITRSYRAVNAPLGAEVPAIRFLERNGYDLHYATGSDMYVKRRSGPLLRRSGGYLSVGHDEYWSYEQRAAVEAAREEGLHLSFWSANEAYWAVRFEASAIKPDARRSVRVGAAGDALEEEEVEVDDEEAEDEEQDAPRTLVCYKETQSTVKLDPAPNAWTGTFRDASELNPRGAMPENALSGTMFASNAHRTDALVVDGGRYGRHRAWWGTAASRMSLGDPPLVLYPGLLGHEWDEDVDNGWRPAALQTLATTTVDNVPALMDHGATFDTASATHSLVLHRRGNGSGAITFGAGTVQWAWGLDELHDVADPQRANSYAIRATRDPRGPCPEVQQLTVNVLAEMGLTASTLQKSLSQPAPSEDTSPPSGVVEEAQINPGDGSFSARGSATDAGGGVVASAEVSWDGGKRWHPAELNELRSATRWSIRWGEPWQKLTGSLPPPPEVLPRSVWLRLSDDSGNLHVSEHGAHVWKATGNPNSAAAYREVEAKQARWRASKARELRFEREEG